MHPKAVFLGILVYFFMNESRHRASPVPVLVHSQQEYIAARLALYKNILLPAVYSQMGYIGTRLV